ncbi:MAG: hypothetical protein IJZ42_06330 [Lachnospiraceae bacterium]|nr:hypothetical protein [Lachnospiraceae bacterium]
MEKTKFGISVALLSMLCYFTGYVNFTACIILFVAVLAWSDSVAAKKNASQAVVLSAFFSLISMVLNWLSNSYMSIISTIFTNWFDLYDVYDILDNFDIMGWLVGLVGFVELVLMFIFVIMSLKGKDVKIPVVTKLVKKHFGEEEEKKAE